jgi:hypothetical protein
MSAPKSLQVLDFSKHRAGLGPVSRANLLGQRPRNAVLRSEAWHAPDVFRAGFPDLWSRFIRRQFTSRDAVAIFFGVTFQTACNWWDAAPFRPGGDKVALAALAFPQMFFEVMGGASMTRPMRRAA